MTQQDTRNQQVQHAMQTAQEALTYAQQAERAMYEARESADPHLNGPAQEMVRQAAKAVKNAQEHLDGNAGRHREQQITQTMDELHQAEDDMEAAQSVVKTPRQIR